MITYLYTEPRALLFAIAPGCNWPIGDQGHPAADPALLFRVAPIGRIFNYYHKYYHLDGVPTSGLTITTLF